ncbi:MAG: DNA repair protein RecN [Fimbriimonas sp.]|nr:DNA repair protein RecN [Fimbriimonas sp.]
MISELRVENLAIINHVELSFNGGFSVLTGETGAGKSLMIDALELALGERADTDLVRTGAAKASVQLVLDLSSRPDLLAPLSELGLELEDGRLFILREVFAEGRSVARVNGRTVPIATLKALGRLIVDLHGQHQHQALLDQLTHVGYLDQWIGAEALAALLAVDEAYSRFSAVRTKMDALRRGLREREQRLDMLRFQVNEIRSFAPNEGEEEELTATLSRLKNLERITQSVQVALASLSEGEVNARDLLAGGSSAVSDALRFDSSLDSVATGLEAAIVHLDESVHTLSAYFERLDADPGLLDLTTERLDGLKRLKRKYGETEVAILNFCQSAEEELATLEDAEASEESLGKQMEAASAELAKACDRLSTVRRSKAEAFVGSMREHLDDLSMGKARLEVSMKPSEPTAAGADEVEFLFSANAGEPPKPLAKIASGGEVSRVMLALKSALAGRAGVPTLLFDEVDTGLGGKAAAAVGRKLAALGAYYQVIAISHLPQVAAWAAHQYRIEKREEGGRSQTSVVPLSQQDRVEEIARMLAGDEVTETAMANARELLQVR